MKNGFTGQLEWLQTTDETTFTLINRGLRHEWLDLVMTALSSHWIWLPAVVFSYLFLRHRPRAGLMLVIAGILVGLSDLLGYQVLKPFFARQRPCHSLEMVELLKGCGGRFGFPSNHAMNSATFAYFLTLHYRSPWLLFLVGFAGLVALSRVYLGVHYPMDILFGHSLGFLIALLAHLGISKRFAP